jgi:outer membrane lipoprotein SlyB
MRLILVAGLLSAAASLSACATNDYASACQRDYERNRAAATAAGAVIGGAAGAAIDKNDTRGAAIGAIAGGVIGSQLAKKDDPCGYGFTGYDTGRYYRRY